MSPAAAAIRDSKRAEGILPERPEAYYFCALGWLLLDRGEMAISELEKALQFDVGFVPAQVLLGNFKNSSLDRRKELMNETYSGAPGWEQQWLAARESMQGQNWKSCAAAYSTLLRESSGGREPYLGASAEFCLGKGRALLEDGNLSGAIEA